jgi:HSP20 family molecular chaperone IbpA
MNQTTNQTVEQAIVGARAVLEQITGAPAPEFSTSSPYARIPPEVDAEEYVTMKAASLLEKVRSMPWSTMNRTPGEAPTSASTGPAPSGAHAMPSMPIPAAIIRGENELRWVLEMPGVPRSTVEVELLGATLRVSGARPAVSLEPGDQVLGSDLAMGRVERVLTLPMAVEASDVHATLSDGILTVRVRFPANKSRAQKIEVR